jgi:protein SCO1/2
MNASTLRMVRIAVWAVAVILAVAVVWVVVIDRQGGVSDKIVAAGAGLGGPFSLTDTNGHTVTEAALQGHPSALFFGYTFCPDVCPTTLSDVTVWLQDLGPDADKLKFYFITIDPERDTREQMAAYLEAFDPRIVGLTGSRAAIDQIIKDYRVYAHKVPGSGADDYTMDHTASIYLLDAKAQFFGTIDYQEKDDAALAKFRRLIASS